MQGMIALFGKDNEDSHYMGYLVLQTQDNKQFKIIGGQQRLTTLAVLALNNPDNVIERGKKHQANQQGHAKTHGIILHLAIDRTPKNGFKQAKQNHATIQHWYGQQV